MERTSIRLVVAAAFAIAFILGLSPLKKPFVRIMASAQAQAGKGCSVATLQGDYLMIGRADTPAADPQPSYPRAFTGFFTFDGQGNMFVLHTYSYGGDITQHGTARATYTLEPDCSGHVTFATNEWDMYITGDGRRGHLIRTDDGTIATRTFEKP